MDGGRRGTFRILGGALRVLLLADTYDDGTVAEFRLHHHHLAELYFITF